MRSLFCLALSTCLFGSAVFAGETEVVITRTDEGVAYISTNGGTVKMLSATARPKGYTPAVGEDTPFFNFYVWYTPPVIKVGPGKHVASDDFAAGSKCYKITRIADGSFVWYCLSDTSIAGGGGYVNQWSFYFGTALLIDPATDEETGAPYFNDCYGDPFNPGWGAYTVEAFDLALTFP